MDIMDYSLKLKLPYLKKYSKDLITEAKALNLSHEEFLLKCLEFEYNLRKENGIQNKIRDAKFIHKKYLENYKKIIYRQPSKLR